MTGCFLLQCLDYIRWERLEGFILLRDLPLQLLFGMHIFLLGFIVRLSYKHCFSEKKQGLGVYKLNNIPEFRKLYCPICHLACFFY